MCKRHSTQTGCVLPLLGDGLHSLISPGDGQRGRRRAGPWHLRPALLLIAAAQLCATVSAISGSIRASPRAPQPRQLRRAAWRRCRDDGGGAVALGGRDGPPGGRRGAGDSGRQPDRRLAFSHVCGRPFYCHRSTMSPHASPQARLAAAAPGGPAAPAARPAAPAPAAAAARPAAAPVPAAAAGGGTSALAEYRQLLSVQVAKLLDAAEAVGGQVLSATRVLAEGFTREAAVVEAIGACQVRSRCWE